MNYAIFTTKKSSEIHFSQQKNLFTIFYNKNMVLFSYLFCVIFDLNSKNVKLF